MSYNESLRSDSNYPAMSQSQWDNAPWNEPYIPIREFDVNVDVVLYKLETVSTDDYVPLFDEESGTTYANTDDTDWLEAYKSGCFTIPQMLDELRKYVEQDLAMTGNDTIKSRRLKGLLNACKGWEVVETSVEEA